MLKIKLLSSFKKDYKRVLAQGLDTKLLEEVIELLSEEKTLPPKYHDHNLTNSRKYKNMRECHIQPDWLLIYQINKKELILGLVRTGSHSDLF